MVKNKILVARAKQYFIEYPQVIEFLESELIDYLNSQQGDGLCFYLGCFPQFIHAVFKGNIFPFETRYINYFCEIDFRNNPKRRDFILKVLDVIKQLENQVDEH